MSEHPPHLQRLANPRAAVPAGISVVGVLNVTPDSFSDGGRFTDVAAAVEHGAAMATAGAWAVDVGGESTRPGAGEVSIDEEIGRVVPVVAGLAARGIVVSVDTRRAIVAAAAIDAGAAILNDIAGLRDPAMVALAAERRVPAIVMHSPSGDPALAHGHPGYHDVVAEVVAFLGRQAAAALAAGVPEVIVDPGIGFGKSTADNLALLGALDRLVALGHPLLVGASRKRFIGEIAGVTAVAERDAASLGVHLASVARGARLVRAHDVAAHVQAIRLWQAVAHAADVAHAGGVQPPA